MVSREANSEVFSLRFTKDCYGNLSTVALCFPLMLKPRFTLLNVNYLNALLEAVHYGK